MGRASGCAHRDLFHFDGNSWKAVRVSRPGESGVNEYDLFGFNSDNIWLAGSAGYADDPWSPTIMVDMLWHFNGTFWWRASLPYLKRDYGVLYTVYGDRPDNIWAGGTYGSLYHYDGSAWKRDTLNYPNPLPPDQAYYFAITSITGNELHGYYLKAATQYRRGYLFKLADTQWACIDSGMSYESGNLYMSQDGNLYTNGHHVRKWEQGHWTILYPTSRNDVLVNGLHIESDNHIFATINEPDASTLVYFNGANWVEYKEIRVPAVYFYHDVVYIDRELFVLGQSQEGKSVGIVWHGKPVNH